MTEDAVLTEPIIIVAADHLIPHSQGILPRNGPQDKLPKLLILQKEQLCRLGEGPDLDPGADLQVLILSAALAAQAAAGVMFV